MSIKPTREELEQRIKVLEEETVKAKSVEEELLKERHRLRERVKELRCLYGLSGLIDKPGAAYEEILQGTADLLPPAWQYPEITHARIILEGLEYKSQGFEEGKWRQTTDIIVHNRKIGAVDVFYVKAMPESDEGPFLKEERNLINEVAERLGRIIEYKWIEESLRESEEKYRRIVVAANEGIWLMNSNFTTRFVNARVAEMIGYEVEEIIGCRFEPFLFEEDLQDHENKIESRKQGITERYERRLRHKDGHVVWTIMSVTPIIDSNHHFQGSFAMISDITERKQVELEKEKLIDELSNALGEIKTLSGLLPICSHCKKIRDDGGYWNQIESYISEHSDVVFSHGLCPQCSKKFYPDFYDRKK